MMGNYFKNKFKNKGKNRMEKLNKIFLKTILGHWCLLSDVQISSHRKSLCKCTCVCVFVCVHVCTNGEDVKLPSCKAGFCVL
jgi:hypothetical protein